MALDKTKTIFQRRIGVYMPTLEAKEKWDKEAERRGLSVSDMVFQLVETHLAGQKEDKVVKTADLQKEVSELTGEVATMRSRIQELETLNARLDNELKEYRAEVFLNENPGKQLDRQLIHVLSSSKALNGLPRSVGEDEILRSLKIGSKDETRHRALAKNLQLLERFQLVKKTAKGWTWNA